MRCEGKGELHYDPTLKPQSSRLLDQHHRFDRSSGGLDRSSSAATLLLEVFVMQIESVGGSILLADLGPRCNRILVLCKSSPG